MIHCVQMHVSVGKTRARVGRASTAMASAVAVHFCTKFAKAHALFHPRPLAPSRAFLHTHFLRARRGGCIREFAKCIGSTASCTTNCSGKVRDDRKKHPNCCLSTAKCIDAINHVRGCATLRGNVPMLDRLRNSSGQTLRGVGIFCKSALESVQRAETLLKLQLSSERFFFKRHSGAAITGGVQWAAVMQSFVA